MPNKERPSEFQPAQESNQRVAKIIAAINDPFLSTNTDEAVASSRAAKILDQAIKDLETTGDTTKAREIFDQRIEDSWIEMRAELEKLQLKINRLIEIRVELEK